MNTVDLGSYQKVYNPGNLVRTIMWYFVNITIFQSGLPYPTFLKVWLLRFFGASVGSKVMVKPGIAIKYPWHLSIGNNVWLGEKVWIDNLAKIIIGNNVCISQGAYLMTGNHDYKKPSFDLIIAPIIIEDGVWVGARAVICPGAKLGTHSVITAGSVAVANTPQFTICQGNPAVPTRKRVIDHEAS